MNAPKKPDDPALPGNVDMDDVLDCLAATARPTGARLADDLALTLLLASIPKTLRRRIDRGDPVCVVWTVPGPDWVDPIARAARHLASGGLVVDRDGSKKFDHKPTLGNPSISLATQTGRSVFGVSQLPEQYLPATLLTTADAHLHVGHPDAKILRHFLRISATGKVPKDIPDALAAGLAFNDIVAAFRCGAPARTVVDILRRSNDFKSRTTVRSDTPLLHDLCGYGDAKQWCLDLATGFAAWRNQAAAWSDLSTSAVFHGKPGTGKTLLARSLALTLGVPLVSASISDFFAKGDGHLGDVISKFQQTFDQARSHKNGAILFLDELDALPDREQMSRNGRDWWTPVVAHALVLLDGASSREGTIILGATNHLRNLDSALIRPGRFDRTILIDTPSPDDLAGILRQHLGTSLPGVDLTAVTRLAPGATGAVAAGWAREAKRKAMAADRDMTIDDLIAVVAPPDNRSPETVRRIAIHELAHAVAQFLTGRPMGDVNIVRTGATEGHVPVRLLPDCATAADIDAAATMLLCGRAAEIAFFDAPTGGAEGDLALATELVAAAHASQGLGGALTHLAPSGKATELLPVDPALRRAVDGHMARLHGMALDLVYANRAAIDAVATELAQRRLVTAGRVADIVGRFGARTKKGAALA